MANQCESMLTLHRTDPKYNEDDCIKVNCIQDEGHSSPYHVSLWVERIWQDKSDKYFSSNFEHSWPKA